MSGFTNESPLRAHLVEKSITQNNDVLDKLVVQLNKLGVESVDDLKEVTEKDVDGIDIPTITKRKFKKLIGSDGSVSSNSENAVQDGNWDFFISHSQQDGAIFAEKIYHTLKGGTYQKTCWLDVYMKERDEAAMKDGVRKSSIFLAIVSEVYFTRPFCIKELEWAVEFQKPMVVVIDVKLKNKIGELLQLCPSHLRNIGSINFIDLNRGDIDYWDVGMNKITKAIPKQLNAIAVEKGDQLKDIEGSLRVPGEKAFNIGNYREAIDCFLKWKEKLISFHDGNESAFAVVGSYVALGSAYEKQGDYDTSRTYLEKALPIQLAELGEMNTDVASTQRKLSQTFVKIGLYKEAMDMAEGALRISTNLFGDKHIDVAKAYRNIGNVYGAKQTFETALKYYEMALNIFTEALGKEHNEVATSLINMGVAYTSLRKFKKAKEYYDTGLSLKIKLLGKDHPEVANCYSLLGTWHANGSTGKASQQKAMECYEMAISTLTKALGEEHPDVAVLYNNIGIVFANLRERKKAEEYLNLALAICIKSLGKDHPSTKRTESNIKRLKACCIQ